MKLHLSDAEAAKAAAEFAAQYRADLEALGVSGNVPIGPEPETEAEAEAE